MYFVAHRSSKAFVSPLLLGRNKALFSVKMMLVFDKRVCHHAFVSAWGIRLSGVHLRSLVLHMRRPGQDSTVRRGCFQRVPRSSQFTELLSFESNQILLLVKAVSGPLPAPQQLNDLAAGGQVVREPVHLLKQTVESRALITTCLHAET